MTYITCDGAVTHSITADELLVGDTIDSHDGLEHEVTAVFVNWGGMIGAAVRVRGGKNYDVTFHADHHIRITA